MKRVIAVFAAVVVVATIGFVIFAQRQEEKTQKQNDLERLSQESYEGVFVSMYSISEYDEEDFVTYRGVKTLKADYQVPSLSVIAEYLECVLATDNQVTNIYLGIDPLKLWENCRKNIDKWNKELQEELLPYLEENPQLSFEIMLPYSQLDYWKAMSEEERNIVLNTYNNFIGWMEGFSNVTVYFMGAEQWLISNPENYTAESGLVSPIARKVMLFTFCDHTHQINSENANEVFSKLMELVTEELEYPDLSEWKLIFWGDSVIGNYVGSYSVPGVVKGLSGASTYNYAIGGTQAADFEGYNAAFPDMVEKLKTRELGDTQDGTEFPYDVLEDSDAKLCFLVHYGLNDYFSGIVIENPEDLYDEETFSGALRVSVKNLKEKYPNAVIILMTPPFCCAFSYGTDRNSEVGGVLTEYVAAVEKVAEEQNVLCMNNYVGLGITAENEQVYLADGVHLNEYGRFVLGQQIVEVLGQFEQ